MTNVFHVTGTDPGRPVTGHDSGILGIPKQLYVQVGDGPAALDVSTLARGLRQISQKMASDLGEVLHHATWQITADPAVIEKIGIHEPGCGRCRHAVDQALAHVAHTGEELLVGTLYWAG